MERKLAVILVADIVGYSAQMERDEAGTYTRVTARRREIFEPAIARHQGRIFKLVGDGLLAEFGSAVQAVECAISLQTSLAERNLDVAEDQRILARIGINLGEVIVDGDDRLGEGVNIAARLEQLAEPGGICVSEKVAREVERKLAFGFESMGQRRVKNIAEPLNVYRVSPDAAQGPRRAVAKSKRRFWGWSVAAVLAVGVLGSGGAWLLSRSGSPDVMPAQVALLAPVTQTVPPARAGLSTLLVRPFVVADNIADADVENLGEALPRDIVNALATSPDLASVSGTWAPVAGVSSEPDYTLIGEVTLEGETFSVDATLMDTASGDVLWTGNRTFAKTKFTAERESYASRVYASLLGARGELVRLEEARTWEKPTEALTEYDFHLRGTVRLVTGTDPGRAEALTVWRQGLERFPDSALLRLDLAEATYRQAVTEPVDTAAQSVSSAWVLVGQAEERLDRQSDTLRRASRWRVHLMRAILLPLVLGDFDGALKEAQQARGLMPHDTQVNADLALVMANAGWSQTAVDWASFAVDRKHNPPDSFQATLGWALYLANRADAAVEAYARMSDPASAEHAAALIRAGRR